MEQKLQKITGAQRLVRFMHTMEIDTIFAVPGVQLDWFFHSLEVEKSSIRIVVPRHEQATTYMADGYFRATGKIGIAMVVPGPGMLNAMAGLSTAYAAHSRVLLLAAQIRSEHIDKGYGLLHEIKGQAQVLSSSAKSVYRSQSADDLVSAFHRAYHEVSFGESRPVALEIPQDHLSGIAVSDSVEAMQDSPVVATNEHEIAAVARLIEEASSPLIYCGGGVVASETGRLVEQIANLCGMIVVTSENGRGALSDRHPLVMSVLGGQKAFSQADLVISLGSRFVDLQSGQPIWDCDSTEVVSFNHSETSFEAARYHQTILGDLAATLPVLLEKLSANAARSSRAIAQAGKIREEAAQRLLQTGLIYEYVQTLRQNIPEDCVLVNELTQVGYLCRVAYPVYSKRTLLGPGYQGTLGYGFSTALGVACGTQRRVFAISGDGGFGWSMQELATAARYNLDVTLILFNDNRFSNVHALQKTQFGFSKETDVYNPDFKSLADAFKVRYAHAANPKELGAQLRATLLSSGPTIIEVPVGDLTSPWPFLRLQ